MIRYFRANPNYIGWKVFGVILVSLGLIIATGYVELLIFSDRNLYVKKTTINDSFGSLTNFAGDDEELNLLLLSDFHNHSLDYKNTNIVGEINKIKDENKVDLIAITGDFIDDGTRDDDIADIDKVFEALSSFSVPTFFTTGNHERNAFGGMVEKELALVKKYNFTYLDYLGGNVPTDKYNNPDYYATIDEKAYPGNYYIYGNTLIIGAKDPYLGNDGSSLYSEAKYEMYDRLSGAYEAAQKDKNFSNVKYKILITHKPNYYDYSYLKYDFDLILCGHTHGGQVNVFNFRSGMFAHGYYEDKKMYVTQGLGVNNTYPFRIGTQNELSYLTIKS
ncbi:MAG: metallophosphoesterase [Erysipelotrichaceae bacterium]|nr:metallophosphoesterase [Erysipelotrichaceae bacterium]MCB9499994.1 metallophosphoesterase [Erysipelotrichaceae bacterium]